MTPQLILVLVVIFILVGVTLLLLLGVNLPGMGNSTHASQVSKMVSSQRQQASKFGKSAEEEEEVEHVKIVSASLTLDKKLRYAQWRIPPLLFYVAQVVISLISVYVVGLVFNKLLTCAALLVGPIFVRSTLNRGINKRFKAFDKDYAAFLVSLVSLLKTGMETLSALEAAANGLEDGSLVQEEVILMLDRLRFGVSEEKSIGAFGEDVYHPEIELFVQALLLSRSVGGNLSETLDRLAKQVRKRQRFRADAEGAVGMQKGSIYFILLIMVAMEIYMYFMYPAAILDAINDDFGWQIWQVGITLILLGMFWIKQVTKIRI